MLHETFAPRFPHQNRPNSPRRRAPPCRPATALAHVAPSLPAPRTRPRWITHAAYSIPGQSPLDSTPGRPNLASPVSLRRGSFCSGEQRRRPARRVHPRLHNLDLTARSHPSQVKGPGYRSAPSYFVKEPSGFCQINPQSRLTQKYFNPSPVFYRFNL